MNDYVSEWLSNLIKGMVSNSDAVSISKKSDELGVLFTVDLDPRDSGIVVGREGANAKALRTLLRAVGMKNQMRASLKLNIPERAPREQY